MNKPTVAEVCDLINAWLDAVADERELNRKRLQAQKAALDTARKIAEALGEYTEDDVLVHWNTKILRIKGEWWECSEPIELLDAYKVSDILLESELEKDEEPYQPEGSGDSWPPADWEGTD